MVSQLSHITECLHLDGVDIHQRHLEVPSATPDGHLIVIAHHLVSIRDYIKWALGSALLQMLKRRPSKDGQYSEAWLKQFCEAARVDVKERTELLAVCLFYPPSQRTLNLSFNHYRDAMYGANDGTPDPLPRSLAFLLKAHQEGWTVPQLRRYIRTHTKTPEPTAPKSNLSTYAPVFAFRRFASSNSKDLFHCSKDRAKLILSDLGEDVPLLLSRLQRIANSST